MSRRATGKPISWLMVRGMATWRVATVALPVLAWFAVATFLTSAAATENDAPADRPSPRLEIALHLAAGTEQVELGKAFTLTVVRLWSRDLKPETWRDEQLAPLVARPVDVTRREVDGCVEEVRRFRCFAFSLDEVTVPAPVIRARPRTGGPERVARGRGFRLQVSRLLDPAAPGAAELPGGLLPQPAAALPWMTGGAAALVLLGFLIWIVRWWARRRAARAMPKPPDVTPHARAFERLHRLRAGLPESLGEHANPDELEACYQEAAVLMRDYLDERYALDPRQKTAGECLAALHTKGGLEDAQRDLLAEYFAHCDLVRFGAFVPAATDAERQLEAATRFVEETREEQACDAVDAQDPACAKGKVTAQKAAADAAPGSDRS